MKITTVTHICDVCGRRENASFDKPWHWEFIYYGKTWSSGGHSGDREEKFLACEACLKEDSRKLFKKLLDLFKANKEH
jgi:hypothetical protein